MRQTLPLYPAALCFGLMLSISQSSLAHGPVEPGATPERHIHFPDTENFQTLVLDLHTHSVFSDGHVWPTIRVSEALRDGLDGLAITEHLEFQPHLSDIPHPDRNRAYEEAVRAAEGQPVKIIPGVEITRTGDEGHINAVFIKDANPLVKQQTATESLPHTEFPTREQAHAFTVEQSPLFHGAHAVEVDGNEVWRPYSDPATYEAIRNFGFASTFDAREVLQAANDQGAFVFLNHPDFERVDSGLNPFHTAVTKDGLLHGIEIANGDHYYPNAHRLALKHDLALIGVSDVHELIEWDYQPEAAQNPGHRPVTLLLSNGDSLHAMREALFARRTIVWWKNMLIGRKAHMQQLLAASLQIESIDNTGYRTLVNIRNTSDALFQLRERSGAHLTSQTGVVEIAPNAVTAVGMHVDDREAVITLDFDVLNALIEPDKTARITLSSQ